MVSINSESMAKSRGDGGSARHVVSCIAVACLLFIGICGVLFIDAYDSRTKLIKQLKDIDPAVIERQTGMKVITVVDYSTMENRMKTAETALKETSDKQKKFEKLLKDLTAEREGLRKQLTDEKSKLESQLTSVMADRESLKNKAASVEKENEELKAEVEELKKKQAEAEQSKGASGEETSDGGGLRGGR